MPCSGAMAFRPVPTRGTDEPPATDGDPGIRVLGPFGREDDAQGRSMLMGKYEVSALQFESVLSLDRDGTCPEPEHWGQQVKADLGWHEAVEFAHLWSLWLGRDQHRLPDCVIAVSPCLPRVDGIAAFVRLPLEDEWELAAFGGAEPMAPPPCNGGTCGDMEYEVWFNENADGQLRPIGLKRPNALGLHDMLGNAEEIVFDLYRPHPAYPQSGGYVVRGGSIHSSRVEIASRLRREVPFYGPDGAVGTPDTGFRVLLSVPVYTSAGRLQNIQSALDGTASPTPVHTSPHSSPDPALEQSTKPDPVSPPMSRTPDGGADMVSIPEGCFDMGSPEDEAGRFSDEERHRVCVEGFQMARYEVTFEEYDRFAWDTKRYLPPEPGWGREQRPVINVSWTDAIAYAAWLSQRTGRTYRLPTEAEWEYAARAGSSASFSLAGGLTTDKANYDGRYPHTGNSTDGYRGGTLPVGTLPPNAWGLHDMHGNVWEWTCSSYAEDYASLELRCTPNGGEQAKRVVRGGSWDSMAASLRVAHRFAMPISYRSDILGFRLVLEDAP